MNKKTLAIALCLIVLFSFTACGEKEKQETDFTWGTFENGHYENEFFSFSIDISPDYIFLSPQEIVDMNTSQYSDVEEEVVPVDINTIDDLGNEALVHFIYATKYPRDDTLDFNPYINIFSENMLYVNNVIDKEDYVTNSMGFTKMIFTQAGINVEVTPLEKVWIGERQFAKGSMTIQHDEFFMNQDMYVITKGNYAIVFLVGYSTADEKTSVESFISTIDMK